MALTKADISRLFKRLDQELAATDTKGELYLMGGAVMCLVFEARESTQDLDAFFKPVRVMRKASPNCSASGASCRPPMRVFSTRWHSSTPPARRSDNCISLDTSNLPRNGPANDLESPQIDVGLLLFIGLRRSNPKNNSNRIVAALPPQQVINYDLRRCLRG